MKIYVASSWKNSNWLQCVVDHLRYHGHEVDCFCEPRKDRFVFHFSEIGDLEELNAISFLEDKRSKKAFEEDKKWIDWADCIVMVLPCGNSAHLEAGYAKGKGKKLYIISRFPPGEFDVMYGFADKLMKFDDFYEQDFK